MTKDNHILGKFDLDGIPPSRRGEPQIEVTFDMDANGILNVSAQEKAGGKVDKITITNDKGRLSKEDIEKLVKDAEKYKSEDDAMAKKVEAKSTLEHYIYTVRNTTEDEKFKDKFVITDKANILEKIKELQQWLDSHDDASTEDFEGKYKELETLFQPIMSKIYADSGVSPDGGMPGMPGGMNMPGGNPQANANVEDLD